MRIDRIKEIRELRGYSQDELAKRCNVSTSQIFRIETGKSLPSADTIAQIAKELEVSADYLLGLTDKPTDHFRERELTAME
jgi:transcriptional regulator with XRE-family HTH domain